MSEIVAINHEKKSQGFFIVNAKYFVRNRMKQPIKIFCGLRYFADAVNRIIKEYCLFYCLKVKINKKRQRGSLKDWKIIEIALESITLKRPC